MRTYIGLVTKLDPNQVFVYGANTEFRHGKGSALQAMKFGAIYGRGGFVGQTWSIITKNLRSRIHPSISKKDIVFQIRKLYDFATNNPHKEFIVAYSGSGSNLNGYTSIEMADMFSSCGNIPPNIVFENEFNKLIFQKH